MNRIYYITNMFPSKKDNYGIFCKKTYDFFNNSKDFIITKMSAIKGKSQKKYFNILRYGILLLDIYFTLIYKINKFDIVYVQYVWKHAFFVAKFIKRIQKNNIKLIINFHGEDLTEFEKLTKKEKESFKSLCFCSDAIIVPSNYFKNLLLNTVSLSNEKKIVVSPSGGVDSKIFFSPHDNKTNNTVIYCSRFDKDKGWDDFIYSASQILKYQKGINFLMMGYGKQTEDAKQLIKELSLKDKIDLIENPKQSFIAKKYTEGSVFIFPTRRLSESLGLVALEAMSCGLPVISSNIGAIPEYIENGKNGFLFKSGDINELTEKILEYFLLPEEEKNKMKKNSILAAQKYKDVEVEKEFIKAIKKYV